MDAKTLSCFKKDLEICFKNIINEFPAVEVIVKKETHILGIKYPILVQKEEENEGNNGNENEGKLNNIKEEMM